jgi:hypothetical protein
MMSKSLKRAVLKRAVLKRAALATSALAAMAALPLGLAVGPAGASPLAPRPDTTSSQPVTGIVATSDGSGYWQVAADGGVFSYGDAAFHGSLPPTVPNAPIVGMARTASNGGYWLVGADGGVFTYGNAGYYGSVAGDNLNGQVVAIVPTTNDAGYWLIGADGGVFTFGNAGYDGSLPGVGVSVDDVVSATAFGSGYCMLAATGSTYCFAPGHNGQLAPGGEAWSMPYPATGIAETPDGAGYWAVDQKGQVYTEGTAAYEGGLGSDTLNAPVAGIAGGANDSSYRLVGGDGGVFTFNASYLGGVSVDLSLAPSDAQNAARKMLPEYDNGAPSDYSCLVDLWNRESGWRWNADNPSSGAYGIPQALPASKMATAGPDYQTNAFTQILWGLGYIRSVYGTTCAAWAHEEADGWYGPRR